MEILDHHTFRSKEELERKLEHYTDIAARDLLERGRKPGLLKAMAVHDGSLFEETYNLLNLFRHGLDE